MPTYLVRLAQAHESFRKVELQALADLARITLEFLKYDEDVGNFKSTMRSFSPSFSACTIPGSAYSLFAEPSIIRTGPNLHSPLTVS
jgi:tRNA G10  N-methylase Trm11